MLSRIRYSLPDIKQALLEVNDEKLSMDDLKIIAKNLPTPEEVECYLDITHSSHITPHRLLGSRTSRTLGS